MKFTIPAKELSAAIASVARIVEAKSTIPILGNIVVSARDDRITIKGTDLDLESSVAVSAAVSEPGETTIPAKLASDAAKKMAGDITFTLDAGDQQATISAGRSRFKWMTLPVDDYPTIAAGEFSHSFALTGAALHSLFSKVEFSISTEETRYYLNGIFFHDHNGEKLRAVATDGHRLARAEIGLPDGADGMPAVIVPRKTAKEVISMALAAKNDEIRIDVSETKVRFTHGSTVLTSKIIDGTFPDYQRVIPTGNNVIAYVDSKTLTSAADRVSTISTERGRAVKLSFANEAMTLMANSPDAGSAEDVIDLDFDAEPMDIGVNAKYLASALGTLGGGKTKIALGDAGSPMLFTAEDDPSLLVVLMPMRI